MTQWIFDAEANRKRLRESVPAPPCDEKAKENLVGLEAVIVTAPSEFAWFRPAIGQTVPILDVYEPTGFIKVRIREMMETLRGHEFYDIEGWLDPKHVVIARLRR